MCYVGIDIEVKINWGDRSCTLIERNEKRLIKKFVQIRRKTFNLTARFSEGYEQQERSKRNKMLPGLVYCSENFLKKL